MSLSLDLDCHVHTIYSGHSGAEMFIPAVMARCAQRRLRRVVILEHVPPITSETYLNPNEWFDGRDDRAALEAVIAEVLPRRERFPGTEFLTGVEADADPQRLDGSLMLSDVGGADVVVAATHLVPGGAEFWFDRPQLPEDEAPETRARWLAWLEAVAANPAVDVLAHPCAELAACRLGGDFGPEFRAAFAPVAAAMAAGGVGFELNEAAVRRFSPQELAGYAALVRRAREAGVRFTVGSDAHRGAQLAEYKLVGPLAEAAGIGEADLWQPRRRAGS